jgi:hypothetical protein
MADDCFGLVRFKGASASWRHTEHGNGEPEEEKEEVTSFQPNQAD